MTNPADPAAHRRIELRLLEHVQRLLDDPRLRIDTTSGMRPVSSLRRRISRADRSEEVRKTAGQAGGTGDFPQGEVLEATFGRSKMVVMFAPVARLRVICTSPLKQLARGEAIKPMTVGEINRILEENKSTDRVPTTIVLLNTGGFAQDTHDSAQRMATRTLVLLELNSAGGFSVWGPAETRALCDLLDPEPPAEKRARIREAVRQMHGDLQSGGIGVDRIGTLTMLPLAIVEDEFKAIAKADALKTQRLDGRLVLYREGATLSGSAGGAAMTMVDRVKSALGGKPTNEKKIAYLLERRDTISAQRAAMDQELELLEKKDSYLRQQFSQAASEPARRRAAAQLYALRKRLDARRQIISALDQQLDVVVKHLGMLEKLPEGKQLKAADAESLASAIAAAEEILLKNGAQDETKETPSPGLSGGALLAEEQEVYDELNDT